MDPRCALFGHDYGRPETERVRETRGDREVLVVREIEECRRCGETTLVVENTRHTTGSEGNERDHGEQAGEAGGADHGDTGRVPGPAAVDDPGGRRVENGGGDDEAVRRDPVDLVCPGCGYRENRGLSSLSAGDFCPACRQAYLTERRTED